MSQLVTDRLSPSSCSSRVHFKGIIIAGSNFRDIVDSSKNLGWRCALVSKLLTIVPVISASVVCGLWSSGSGYLASGQPREADFHSSVQCMYCPFFVLAPLPSPELRCRCFALMGTDHNGEIETGGRARGERQMKHCTAWILPEPPR